MCAAPKLTVEDFAHRAKLERMNPRRNPLKEALSASTHMKTTPPQLGIFCDIPMGKLREDDVVSLAQAGFTFIVADGEHSLQESRIGREQAAIFLRNGITPVQRLHREARSEHGDSLTLGVRGTMMPYATSVAQVRDYLQCIRYPDEAKGVMATSSSRGAYPIKKGDGTMIMDLEELRSVEGSATQGWVQFETEESIEFI